MSILVPHKPTHPSLVVTVMMSCAETDPSRCILWHDQCKLKLVDVTQATFADRLCRSSTGLLVFWVRE